MSLTAELLPIVLACLAAAIVGGVVVAAYASRKLSNSKLSDDLRHHEAQLTHAIRDGFQHNVDSVVNAIVGSSSGIAGSIGDMRQHLGEISGVSAKVDELHSIISNPGVRGAFGERQLQDIVRNMLPGTMYEFQCELPNGRIVDCLIRPHPPAGNIAIDAKFPLANYPGNAPSAEIPDIEMKRKAFARDVKRHISDIAERYIMSGATGQYALMFVPSEAVFFEIHEFHHDVVQYSQDQKVYIVSPTTMMATVMAIRGVMQDARVNEGAQRIRLELTRLTKHVRDLVETLNLAHKHLRNADSNLCAANAAAQNIDAKLSGLHDLGESGGRAPERRQGGTVEANDESEPDRS